MHYNLLQSSLAEYYSSNTVLHLADQQISSLARHRRLKELILRRADEMQRLGLFHRCLYSALHFNRFFKDAVKHTGQTIKEPLSFLRSSHKNNQIEMEYPQCLENFFQLCMEHDISLGVLLRYMASSRPLDAYPSDTHSKLCIYNNTIDITYNI